MDNATIGTHTRTHAADVRMQATKNTCAHHTRRGLRRARREGLLSWNGSLDGSERDGRGMDGRTLWRTAASMEAMEDLSRLVKGNDMKVYCGSA